jgi:FkbM family methyltransferase
MLRLKKLVTVFTNWHLLVIFVRFGVVAAVEHIAVIKFCNPATLLDVGANKGQFSSAFRSVMPTSTIFAFEPLNDAANKFERVFSGDRSCRLIRSAVSNESGTTVFYVADREDSSSLLKLGKGQNEIFHVSQRAETTVDVNRLGALVNLEMLTGPVMLKIDVQGAELFVLKGIEKINLIDFIYVELSYIELYTDQPLFQDVSNFLLERGFVLKGVFNQFFSRDCGAIQADFLFERTF